MWSTQQQAFPSQKLLPHLLVYIYLALTYAGPATGVLSLSCVEACMVLMVLGGGNVTFGSWFVTE